MDNGNVIKINFTSFVAYLLLNNREVSSFDVSILISDYTCFIKNDLDIVEDDDSALYNYVSIVGNRDFKFVINKDIDYDSNIDDGVSFKDYLIELSSCIDISYSPKKENNNYVKVKSKKLFFSK